MKMGFIYHGCAHVCMDMCVRAYVYVCAGIHVIDEARHINHAQVFIALRTACGWLPSSFLRAEKV